MPKKVDWEHQKYMFALSANCLFSWNSVLASWWQLLEFRGPLWDVMSSENPFIDVVRKLLLLYPICDNLLATGWATCLCQDWLTAKPVTHYQHCVSAFHCLTFPQGAQSKGDVIVMTVDKLLWGSWYRFFMSALLHLRRFLDLFVKAHAFVQICMSSLTLSCTKLLEKTFYVKPAMVVMQWETAYLGNIPEWLLSAGRIFLHAGRH